MIIVQQVLDYKRSHKSAKVELKLEMGKKGSEGVYANDML